MQQLREYSEDFSKRLAQHGWAEQFNTLVDVSLPYIASGLGSVTNAQPEHIIWIGTVLVTSSKSIDLRIRVNVPPGSTFNFSFPPSEYRCTLEANQTVSVPVNQFVWKGFTIDFTAMVVIDAPDAGTNYRFSAATVGRLIFNDLNFGASKIIRPFGDSVMFGTGPTDGANMYIKQVSDNYLSSAKLTDLFLDHNFSWGGMTANDGYELFRRGKYTLQGADLIFWCYGINDVGSYSGSYSSAFDSAAQTKYTAAINDVILRRKKYAPSAKLVILGPTPVLNNGRSTDLDIARSLCSAAVTAATEPTKVFYKNLGDSFTRTDTTKYGSGETVGDQKHPSDGGSTDIANNLISFLNTNNIVP